MRSASNYRREHSLHREKKRGFNFKLTIMEIGQKLPEVLGVDQDGKEWTMSELSGSKVVLYIYPRDSTPGCTNQACNLRDNYERFLAQGYKVLGCSIQDENSHTKCIDTYQLPFPLDRKSVV